MVDEQQSNMLAVKLVDILDGYTFTCRPEFQMEEEGEIHIDGNKVAHFLIGTDIFIIDRFTDNEVGKTVVQSNILLFPFDNPSEGAGIKPQVVRAIMGGTLDDVWSMAFVGLAPGTYTIVKL